MNTVKEKLDRLSRLLSNRNAGYLAEVDACLADIIALNAPNEIEELLPVLDDSGDDEAMFMIVHVLERWDDRTYCKALLTVVERLWKSAPRWTQILHIRVMNSSCTRDEYLRSMESFPMSTKQAAQDIFTSIGTNWPKLSGKVEEMVARM
jgi:hypothetical protein